MTSDEWMQLAKIVVSGIAAAIGAASTARWGYAKLTTTVSANHAFVVQKIDHDIGSVLSKMETTYVKLDDHRASVTELHHEKNALRDRCSRVEGEQAAQKKIDEKRDEEIAFLRAAYLAKEKTA